MIHLNSDAMEKILLTGAISKDITGAYYLMHSMSTVEDYEDCEK